MATRISEEDLAAIGMMPGPNGTVIKLAEKEKPDESWSLTQLAGYIHRGEQVAIGFGRAEAVERYFQGHAVHLAHNKCKQERTGWENWCKQNRINRTTAYRVERLYVAAEQAWGSEAANKVSLHSTTELYVKFCIPTKPERRNETSQNGKPPAVAQDQPDSEGEEATDPAMVTDSGGILPFPGSSRNGQAEQAEPSSHDGAEPATETESSDGQEEASQKKREFVFSNEAKVSVRLREPGSFELQIRDDENGVVTLVLSREPTIDTLCQKLNRTIEEDDACDPDELPE
jgi:hypothetical protein